MPTVRDDWVHYELSNPADMLECINNGLVWKAGQPAQQRAVQMLLDGKAQLNDKVPPQIAAYVQARLGTAGA